MEKTDYPTKCQKEEVENGSQDDSLEESKSNENPQNSVKNKIKKQIFISFLMILKKIS